MTAPVRYTREQMLEVVKNLDEWVDPAKNIEAAKAMLRQAEAEVTRLTARWEALKANVREGDAVNTRFGECAFTLSDVLKQMAELEAQR